MTDLWQANWDSPRPFVHPLRTPAGAVLTVDAPDDHPWHHALWSTIKFVDGENFWEEYDRFGVLDTRTVAQSDDPPGPVLTAQIEWRRPVDAPDEESAGDEGTAQGEVVIDEVRTLAHVDLDPTAYAIDWTVELTPRHDVVLDRTPYTTWGGYGGLTLRGAPDWEETWLTLADDAEAHDHLRGERARWCHLQGVAPTGTGSTTVGVAILDHLDNPRHPTPWYASNRAETYGEGWANFCNAAFLWDGSLPVTGGETLVLRHRVVVHDGAWPSDQVESAWQAWTAAP